MIELPIFLPARFDKLSSSRTPDISLGMLVIPCIVVFPFLFFVAAERICIPNWSLNGRNTLCTSAKEHFFCAAGEGRLVGGVFDLV